MKKMMQATAIAVWLVAAGTGIEATGTTGTMTEPAPQDECVMINGVWHCPCPEEGLAECAPPECTEVNGEWYCPVD